MNKDVFLEFYKNNDSIAILRINRPESLNALNNELIMLIDENLNKVELNKNIKALIVIGNKDFAAGADINDMVYLTPNEAIDFTFIPTFNKLEDLRIPTIAAISGYALGGGLEMALACDIRIASTDAVVGLPEIKLGIMPGSGGNVRLPRLIGESRAKEMIYFGQNINAQQAHEYGLFIKVVEKDLLFEKAIELAEQLCLKSSAALSAAKEIIQCPIDNSLYSMEGKTWGLLFGTTNQREGMKAFLEKRRPIFK